MKIVRIFGMGIALSLSGYCFAKDDAKTDDEFDYIAEESKNEFAELKKHIPKNHELLRISPLHGIDGFVINYKVSFGLPFEGKDSCHKKIKGVKLKQKELMVKHKSKAEPEDPSAFTLSHPNVLSPVFPKNLKKAIVNVGGAEAACLLSGKKAKVWSEEITIANVSGSDAYYIAVPPGVKARVEAVVQVRANLLKDNSKGLEIAHDEEFQEKQEPFGSAE